MRLSSRFTLISAFCLLLAIAASLTLFGATRGTSHASSTSKIIFTDCPYVGYCNANRDIDVINPDGSDVTKIGSGFDPELSPDGTMVVYAVVTATDCVTDPGILSPADIYTMNSDGSNVHDIAPAQGCSEFYSPAWSPDGKKIAFSRLSDQTGFAIYIMNADGSNATELVANGAANPSWSPDGTKIIYTDESSNFLHIINADGTNDQNLGIENEASAGDIGVTWSPDGTKIAYIGGGNNGCSSSCIQEVKPDGTGQATLYTSPFGSGILDVSWSPDGTQLALCMHILNPYDGGSSLYKINAVSTMQTAVLVASPVPPSPTPSPTVPPSPVPSPISFPSPVTSPTASPSPSPTAQTYNNPTEDCQSVSWGQLAPPDSTPPTLSLPSTMTLDATSPQGAPVNYTVTATDPDNSPSELTIACSPSSGSVFPIGTTIVNCSASDLAGNSATGSFNIIVNGASDQTTNLINQINSFNLSQGAQNSLEAKLQSALSSLNSGNTVADCNKLNAFINEVNAQTGKSLTTDQANQLINSANQINTVIGC